MICPPLEGPATALICPQLEGLATASSSLVGVTLEVAHHAFFKCLEL
jgi:hypothetical protein